MTELRILNKEGIKLFKSWIEDGIVARKNKEDFTKDPPNILQDDTYTELYSSPSIVVEPIVASSKFELGKALHEQLSDVDRKDLLHNIGLWAWLSLLNIDLLTMRRGKRQVFDADHYIFNDVDYRRYYRNLLRAPWWALDLHKDEPDLCRCVLAKPPHTLSDIWETIGSSRELLISPAVLHAVNTLYYDESRKDVKTKTTDKHTTPGRVRRLVAHCHQFQLTHLLRVSDKSALLELLPKKEYSMWLKS